MSRAPRSIRVRRTVRPLPRGRPGRRPRGSDRRRRARHSASPGPALKCVVLLRPARPVVGAMKHERRDADRRQQPRMSVACRPAPGRRSRSGSPTLAGTAPTRPPAVGRCPGSERTGSRPGCVVAGPPAGRTSSRYPATRSQTIARDSPAPACPVRRSRRGLAPRPAPGELRRTSRRAHPRRRNRTAWALGAGVLEHGGEVVDEVLEWRQVAGRIAVRDTRAAAIDHDDAREGRQAPDEPHVQRVLPHEVEVVERRQVEKVVRTLPDRDVTDRDVAVSCVANLRRHLVMLPAGVRRQMGSQPPPIVVTYGPRGPRGHGPRLAISPQRSEVAP